jgi:hypothetical protein
MSDWACSFLDGMDDRRDRPLVRSVREGLLHKLRKISQEGTACRSL